MQTEQQRQEFVSHVENLISTLAEEGGNATLTYVGKRKQGYAPYRKIDIVLTHPRGTQWDDLNEDEKIAVLRYMLRDYPGFVFDRATEDALQALVRQGLLAYGPELGRALYRGMTRDSDIYEYAKRLAKENERLRRENEQLKRSRMNF